MNINSVAIHITIGDYRVSMTFTGYDHREYDGIPNGYATYGACININGYSDRDELIRKQVAACKTLLHSAHLTLNILEHGDGPAQIPDAPESTHSDLAAKVGPGRPPIRLCHREEP